MSGRVACGPRYGQSEDVKVGVAKEILEKSCLISGCLSRIMQGMEERILYGQEFDL